MDPRSVKTGLAVSRLGDGIAPIKAEYLLFPLASNGETTSDDPSKRLSAPQIDDDEAEGNTAKRQRTDESGQWKRLSKAEKKARTGQNKARKFKSIQDDVRLCYRVAEGQEECSWGESCKMSHDLKGFLRSKGRDVRLVKGMDELQEVEPFVKPREGVTADENGEADGQEIKMEEESEDFDQIIDTSTTCPLYSNFGHCSHGWKCRFLGSHVRKLVETDPAYSTSIGGWQLLKNDDKFAASRADGSKDGEFNIIAAPELREIRNFDFPAAIPYLMKTDPGAVDRLSGNARRAKQAAERKSKEELEKAIPPTPVPAVMDEEEMMNAAADAAQGGAAAGSSGMEVDEKAEEKMNEMGEGGLAGLTGAEKYGDDVPMRAEEKKRLDWGGKTYLAPLTTVGNLPFRRICVDYGADITCGEMAMGDKLIEATKEEWALVRRHTSEKTFGVQLCGGKPGHMVPSAEVVRKWLHEREGGEVDFVDINLGCPIDLVFQRGAGSALFDRPNHLGKILVGMNKMLGEIPLTVKFRTGIKKDKNIAHNFVPRFATEWGISAMTLHGRSRQQRYSKNADWGYIKTCAQVLRDSCTDAGYAAPPIFGNGDCFSAQSYYEEMEASGVDGIMVARGALIKPWIFTEIQEKREWDISAVERLEGLRKYAEYGLTHWGTDTQGVNTTRRFLCEAMSFQHRYVPIGLLERMPAQINERPPAYKGRNELETLLASADSQDWVKISEMFLGKSPENFNFVPKHKSNAYSDSTENQG